jgi:uncharacterized protein (DUF433 family)
MLLGVIATLMAMMAVPAMATTTDSAARGSVEETDTEPATDRAGCPTPDGHRFPFIRFYLAKAAETIGIPVTELVREIADGSTIAEVAEANGVDPETVVSALVAPTHRKIDALVEDGCLRPEVAEGLKAAITERISGFVYDTPQPDPDRECRRPVLYRFHGLRAALMGSAAVIGVEVSELVRALHDGESVASVAEANGVDPQDVIAALTATAAEHLDALVEAECLRPEMAEALLAKVVDRIEAFVFKEGFGPPDGKNAIR